MMVKIAIKKLLRGSRAFLLLPVLLLAGCEVDNPLWFLNPNGPIASASVYYLVIEILLLLIVIVPATVLVLWAVWRYRRGGGGRYDPAFTHSKLIEAIVWGGPIMLVGVLSYFSVQGAYAVDPYHPGVLNASQTKPNAKPLKIDVITTAWQWLFVYPEQGIAVSNKLVLPVDRKIDMELTSAAVTNDFYILKLVGQIYVMPGMRTERRFLVDRPGQYWGYSTEFSGPGFSWMDYNVYAVRSSKFQQWVRKVKQSDQRLSYDRFKAFAQPTINVGNVSQTFSSVAPDLFQTVIRRVNSGQLSYQKPQRMTEDMHSAIFKRHAN